MHLHSYKLKNYRRMRDVLIELASDISIFVGANNSGKTSATQAIQMFLSGSKDRFSLFDFSSHTWKKLDDLGNLPDEADAEAEIPSISLDLWFEVTAADLYLVIPLLPSTAWQGTQVGLRIEFGAKNALELLQKFRAARLAAQTKVAALEGGAGAYVPWPRSLSDFLQKELQHEFEFRHYVLDRAQFNARFVQNDGYEPSILAGDQSGASILKSLIRVDSLNAQRHLADPSAGIAAGVGRSEDLSKRLSRFYQRNLDQRQEDHKALKALFDSEAGLNTHLADVFEPTLKRLARLGYPGLNNPRLEIKSALNPASIMTQDARVHYVLGAGADAVILPDTYNGLGFKNLIYMVVEILDLQAKWVAEKEARPPLHLIFIEEPEAHLHAQLQQVFIRNILKLLKIDGEDGSVFCSQTVVTTHSPHILYERGFKPIRYFRRRSAANAEQTTQVLNLSAFYSDADIKDRDFLERYLKLTHCDLFFADAAVLVEGNVERLLLPVMIEKGAVSLRSACLCILEVGGAFGHRFKSLIDFLGLVALVITDIDSVAIVADPEEEDEHENTEFLVPGDGAEAALKRQFGKACLAGTAGAVTSNQTLIQWLPKKQVVAELFAATPAEKIEETDGGLGSKVCVAYQIPTEVEWNGSIANLCGRTLEEAFGLENAVWCQAAECRHLGLNLRQNPASPVELAAGLHKRITGKGFDKTKFALGVLSENADSWRVPLYIKQGLEWLQEQVNLEIEATLPEAPITEAAAAE
jgi:predicted ATP-dependent endonuclease of OLD family